VWDRCSAGRLHLAILAPRWTTTAAKEVNGNSVRGRLLYIKHQSCILLFEIKWQNIYNTLNELDWFREFCVTVIIQFLNAIQTDVTWLPYTEYVGATSVTGLFCSSSDFPTLCIQLAHLVWQVYILVLRNLIWCERTALCSLKLLSFCVRGKYIFEGKWLQLLFDTTVS
jgi:hypothetical protein